MRPGVVDTDINADWIDEPGARESAADLSVFNRLGTPEDVADIVRHLASDQSRWITGQAIDATGGAQL